MWAPLSNPVLYRLSQSILGSKTKTFYDVLRFVLTGIKSGGGSLPVVLDIGCGEGKLAARIGDLSSYHGVDVSERHIDYAKRRYKGFGNFLVLDIRGNLDTLLPVKPDLVLVVGVLHNIDDRSISEINQVIDRNFSESIFISIDGVFREKQNLVARLLLTLDRGKFVRSLDAYKQLMSGRDCFLANFLRIPYDHVVFYKNIDLQSRFEEFRRT